MAKLTIEDVQKIADLIKIRIDDADLEKYRQQLSTVLDSLELFSELDTENTKITSQVTGLVNVLRSDEVSESLDQSEALKNGHQTKNGYFVVKKVL
jgi:aspartyl-tRNA(Asn)/glutamyl-tRNA(Gln) amidotransferase subunit C